MSWVRVPLEGLVIVASILLAFVIDASWDGHQDSLDEAELVAAIAQDLSRSRARMQEILAAHDARRTAFDEFLGSGVAELSSLSADSARYLALAIYSTSTLNLSDGVIRRADLSQFSAPELRSGLREWLELAADQQEAIGLQLERATDVYFAGLRAYPDLADQLDRDRRPGVDATIPFDTDGARILVAWRSSRDFVDKRIVLQFFEDIDHGKIRELMDQTDLVLELTGS